MEGREMSRPKWVYGPSGAEGGEVLKNRADPEGSCPREGREVWSGEMGRNGAHSLLVPKAGLEPARLAPHAPQTCVSAISPLRHQRSFGRRGRRIIEVGQNPCQSIVAPVESGGSYSPGPSTLCRVTTASPPRLMISLNGVSTCPSLHCSTSTTRFCPEWPARYDSFGICGGAVWWDGVS